MDKFIVRRKKERRRIIIITRYDYNLTIMKSPKLATVTGLKNKLKATLNFCGIVSANLKMETGRNFSMSAINSGR